MNLASKIKTTFLKSTLIAAIVATLFVETFVTAQPALAQVQVQPPLPQPQVGTQTGTTTAQPSTSVQFDTTINQWQAALGSKKYNKQTFDFQSLLGTGTGLVTLTAGCIEPITTCPKEFQGKDNAISKINSMIVALYTAPPASSVYYAQDVIHHINPVQPAYAQQAGVGYTVMQPFLDVWKAVRNMTYLLFVLGIVALGFMVMFRRKISPQAVMTVQAALPRIIMALVFITFSYAIVGFVLDLMYVLFGMLVWGLDASKIFDGHTTATNVYSEFVNASSADTNSFIFRNGFYGAGQILFSQNLATGGIIAGGFIGIVIAVLAIFSAGPGALAVAMTMLPFLLGLLFALVFFLFRVLITVARAYLNLIIFTVFAPIIILFSTLSGKGIWDGWLKNVVSNILVFLVIGVIVMLTNVLIWMLDKAGATLYGPPYVGSQSALLKGMIALGAVMAIPSVPDIINQFMNIRPVNVQLPQFDRIANQFQGGIHDAFRQASNERRNNQATELQERRERMGRP